jgi:enoyl-CoA hydratase
MEDVLYQSAGHVATITINRLEARNALNESVLLGLRNAMSRSRSDPEVRAVVLTGAGDSAFCAGADLKSGITRGTNAGALESHDARRHLAELFLDLTELGKPVVARVNGHALAGGFGLAMACDIVIASDRATFGTPEINVGLWPMMISAVLIRAMPPKVALELMMSGRRVDAAEGLRLGFLHRVVASDELDSAVALVTGSLLTKSPAVMRLGRDSFYTILDLELRPALRHLQSMLTVVTQTEDAAEGVRAFAEKREPVWKGH